MWLRASQDQGHAPAGSCLKDPRLPCGVASMVHPEMALLLWEAVAVELEKAPQRLGTCTSTACTNETM